MRGIITDIHRCSTVDGPGIRTTVFLKGCPLRCLWCHNPETWKSGIEAGYGREVTAKEVVGECLKDSVYYGESGGGVTLSGGEPAFQRDFSLEILRQLQQAGIHTALDTCGWGAWDFFKESLKVTDLYLFDYKATDPEQHEKLTRKPLDPIRKTLQGLHASGAKIILRCPLVPGINDQQEHLEAISSMENRYPGLLAIEILPWHTMGKQKYKNLKQKIDPRLPKENCSERKKEEYRQYFARRGNVRVKIIG